MVLSLALAGCAGDDDDGGDGSSTSQSRSGSPTNSTGLAAVIKVLVAGNATSPANGSIPVDAGVELTFDGSNSTGPIVEYAWDFGDNATGADETETHSYAAGGLYNVTLTVKGLGNASANSTVRVEVAEDASGGFLFTAVHAIEGELPLLNPNSCTNQDIDCRDHAIPVVDVDANGTPALAKAVRIVVSGSSDVPVGDMQVFWRSPDGTNLNSTGASGLEHALQYSGDMPAGEYVVRVRLFTAALVSYTGTVEVDYVAA